VPHSSLHACCALYPAEIERTLRIQCDRYRLRREMSGSALGLFLFRGCRLHFMLRPACLLPAVQLLPFHGLSTSRSGHRDLSLCLGPATRCFGAYRGGTLTRKMSAACNVERYLGRGRSLRRITTHHSPSVTDEDTFPLGRFG